MSTFLRAGRVLSLVMALVACLVAGVARAHEFPLDIAVSTYVKVEGARAEVLVRAPLFLFKSDRFPVRGSELDIAQAQPALDRATESVKRAVVLMRDGEALAPQAATATLSLPSDRSFDTWDSAVAHIEAPRPADLELTVDQGFVDVRMTFGPIAGGGPFALRTRIAPELGEALKLSIRWIPPDGKDRAFLVNGGSGTVALDPSWSSAAKGFVGLGVEHILTGFDHLLFLLCIVVPLTGARQLLAVITTFTLAHSVSLISAAFGMTPDVPWFAPLVEVLIAVSIVYTALDNIIGADLRRRLALTLAFGFVHGLAFSYALKEQLQFAGTHLLTSLLAFNVGIELGQLGVLMVMLPLLWIVRRWVLPGRVGAIVLSALMAHVGWHWMEARWDLLMRQRIPLPAADQWIVTVVAIGIVGSAGALVAWHRRRPVKPDMAEPALDRVQS